MVDELHCILVIHLLLVHDSADTVLVIGGDEDFDTARMLAQDVVGCTAHNDARTFGGHPLDDAALQGEEVLFGELVVRIEVAAAYEGLYGTDELAQKSLSLVVVVKHVTSKASFLGGLRQDYLVVVSHVESFCQLLAQQPSAAAQLTAYSDYKGCVVFHRQSCLSCVVKVNGYWCVVGNDCLLRFFLLLFSVVFKELVDELDTPRRAASAKVKNTKVDEQFRDRVLHDGILIGESCLLDEQVICD